MARSLGRNAAHTFGVGLGTFGLGLATSIITARVLGPYARGMFTLVTILPHTLSTLVKLGLAQGSVYSIRSEKVDPSTVASHLLLIGLGISLPILVGLVLFRDQMAAAFLKGADSTYFLFVLPVIPLLIIKSYFFGVLQGLDHFVFYNRVRLVYSVLAPATMFVALVACGGGLRTAILVSVGLEAVVDIWLVMMVRSLCPFRFRWDPAFARRLLKFGLKSHLQTMATHLHMRIDVYLIAAFLNPAEMAFYSIATRMAELIFHVPESLGLVVYPRQAGSTKDRLEDLTATACRHTMFSTVILGAGLLAVGPWLIRLWYGADYAPAAGPLPFIVVGVIVMSLFFMLTRNFTSQNRQEINLLASLVALVGNVALNVVLIPRMGIAGAGLATALSYSLGTAILARVYLRESGKRLRHVLVLQSTDVSVYRRLAGETLGRWLPRSAAGRAG